MDKDDSFVRNRKLALPGRSQNWLRPIQRGREITGNLAPRELDQAGRDRALVERERIDQMEATLKQSGIRNIQLFELGTSGDTNTRGMTSSGMIVVNPPWTLKQRIEPALRYLVETLGVDGHGFARSEQLVEE